MLNSANLSLDQAPPISIPFRFFLTAPLFALCAGLLLLWYGPDLLISRWSPLTLGLTHLLTLGFLTMVMCGALMQMLPVLAGSPLPQVVKVGWLVHLALTAGVVLLVLSFFGWRGFVTVLGLSLLGFAFALFVGAVAIALWRVKHPNMTIVAMRLALVGLLLAVVLGLIAGGGLFGLTDSSGRMSLVQAHLSWGLMGWMGLLLIGISYQVVPMFQVTPEYPIWMRQWLAPGLFSLLLLAQGVMLAGGQLPALLPVLNGLLLLVMLGFGLFAIVTLRLQKQRKRRIPDVTLMFWRVGMWSLLACILLWIAGQFIPAFAQSPRFALLLGLLLLFAVAVPLVNGMFYKIVPFLSWFHLQNRQMALKSIAVQVPNMKQFVPDRAAKQQFYLYLVSLGLLLPALWWPGLFARPAGLLFSLSNIYLAINLIKAIKRYQQTNRAISASAGVEADSSLR